MQTKKQLASQAEGWEYAPMFTMKFHAKERKVDLFRRRRWHRRMVPDSSTPDENCAPCYFQMPKKVLSALLSLVCLARYNASDESELKQ